MPLGSKVSVGPDGQVLAGDPAAPDAPPQPVGRIRLVSTTGTRIAKGLDGLFRVQGGGVLPADDAAQVTVGSLEQSNVQPTEILVQMVEAQRLYDLRTKCIATAREIDQAGADLMKLS